MGRWPPTWRGRRWRAALLNEGAAWCARGLRLIRGQRDVAGHACAALSWFDDGPEL